MSEGSLSSEKSIWNGEGSSPGDLRTGARGVVGEVTCVSICEGNGDGEAEGDGREFHSCWVKSGSLFTRYCRIL